MSNLYNRIEALCQKASITITTMCKESGASRASLSDLKVGRKQSLSAETLSKIAGYFGVSVDYLLGNEQKENAPTPKDEREIGDDDIKFALFGTREIDDDVLDRVKQFAKFAQENEKNK